MVRKDRRAGAFAFATQMLWISRALALATAAIAGAVLVGYVTGTQSLISVAPGFQGMAATSAVGLLLVALSIAADGFDRSGIARRLAGAAATIAVVVLALHAFDVGDALSNWLISAIFGRETSAQMSAATATSILLLAMAARARQCPRLADYLGAAVVTLSGIALLGYAYGVQDLYSVYLFKTMALHTAAALLMLSLASLLVRPRQGWASVVSSGDVGGVVARRQLVFTLVPPVLGWVLLNQTHSQLVGASAAMAFLVILIVVPLAIVVLQVARVVNALERERREKEAIQADYSRVLETRLAAQADQLAHESAERIKAQQIVAQSQRLEAVGQLTGGIAHDFNNILMAIGGNLKLLARSLDTSHPAARFVDRSHEAIDLGAKLTGQLLAFSRTQKLHIRPVEVDQSIVKVRELLGTLGPNISIAVTLRATGVRAMADPDQLELAILNLAFNARDAMPDGGTLTLQSRARRLSLDGREPVRDYLSIEVGDSGIGMSAEVATRAIEPFYTTKPRGKGTGLGLAQAYGFSRQCQGDLRIDSTPGQGTIVQILLPIVEAAGADQPPYANPPATTYAQTPGDAQLVLVIDDDESVRRVMVDALVQAGFKVIEASDGEQGLALLHQQAPVMAIIDFIMPGLNGAQVARVAREHRPDLPIIFVSGYFDTVALDQVPDAPILRKPFDVDHLREMVASTLAQR